MKNKGKTKGKKGKIFLVRRISCQINAHEKEKYHCEKNKRDSMRKTNKKINKLRNGKRERKKME